MKNRINTVYKILIIVLLLIIAYTSFRNMLYLEDINNKLSVLPTFDFTSIEDYLKNIKDTLSIDL